MFDGKIKNKELCPCGSGLSYAACCKNRKSIERSNSKEPPEIQVMKMMKSSMKSVCIHPDKNHCTGHIKNAHALQNKKIISRLEGKNHTVYMLGLKQHPGIIQGKDGSYECYAKITEIQAKKATTETCFCDYHDNVAFSAIEDGAPDFDISNDKMKFTYAYKAFAFEYYKQLMSLENFRRCFKECPDLFAERESVFLYRKLQKQNEEFLIIKKYFDDHILSGTFDGLYTCAIKLDQEIKFADYAYIALYYDLDGNRIKHTQKGIMHRVSLTIFPEEGRSWLLLSCLKNERKYYRKLFEAMENASEKKIMCYLNLMLPLMSENIVLSPILWDSWDEDVKAAYTYYANLKDAEAMKMLRTVGFGLKNLSRKKLKTVMNLVK